MYECVEIVWETYKMAFSINATHARYIKLVKIAHNLQGQTEVVVSKVFIFRYKNNSYLILLYDMNPGYLIH